jgi:hypothetical protein
MSRTVGCGVSQLLEMVAGVFDEKSDAGDERNLEARIQVVRVVEQMEDELAAKRPREFSGGDASEPVEEAARKLFGCGLEMTMANEVCCCFNHVDVVVDRVVEIERIIVICIQHCCGRNNG